MKSKLCVVKKLSNAGKEYIVAYIDYGFSKVNLSFQVSEICTYTNLRMQDLIALKVDQVLEVADLVFKVGV